MKKGFTLVELLIVIAIIAVLSVVVILVLNAPQLIQQSRDATRLSDLSTLNGALGALSADQAGKSTFSLGSSSVTYLSIPDPTATTTAGTDCSGIGFPGGGAFHCPASSTYRNINGTGWIPVNFSAMSGGASLSQLPVDPTNQTSSNFYYTYQTDGTTFKVRSIPESQGYLAQAGTNPSLFTAGSNLNLGGGPDWILVPGNATFGTSNFYAMKYDAVCANSAGVALSYYPGPGYNGFNDAYLNCTPANGLQVSSLPGGFPIVLGAVSTGTVAVARCNSIGAHLMTNNEWQTIAWNVENVASNWTGGVVGSGTVYSGHDDNAGAVPYVGNPAASVASPNDSLGYYGTDGPTSGGGSGAGGAAAATQRRTLTLSNGSVIWDFTGNVWQLLNNTIVGTNEPYASPGGFTTNEFTAITNWGTLSQQQVGPSNPLWTSAQGIGVINSEGQTDPTVYGFIRGGYWGNGQSGVQTLGLGNGSGYAYTNWGFRCSR